MATPEDHPFQLNLGTRQGLEAQRKNRAHHEEGDGVIIMRV